MIILFLEVCGQAGPSICELIKSLCEGGGRLLTGLRGRGVRKVLEILNWKAWNFGNYWGSEDNISIRKFFASLACIYPSARLQAMKIGVHNPIPDIMAKFLENKIYTKKRVYYDKIHSKLPIFLCYYGKIHSKLPIFRVKSVKIYTGQKKFTWEFSWLSWQIWGM